MYWWAAIHVWYMTDTLYHSRSSPRQKWYNVSTCITSVFWLRFEHVFGGVENTCIVTYYEYVSGVWYVSQADTFCDTRGSADTRIIVYFICILVTHVSQPSQSAWCWKYTENTDVIVSNTHIIHKYCHEYHKKNRIQFEIHVIHH